jgi:hypothetical protein
MKKWSEYILRVYITYYRHNILHLALFNLPNILYYIG